jgi:hypothetical protein
MKWTESTSSAQILKKTQPEEFDIVNPGRRHGSDTCGVDLISDALRFGALWYAGPNAIKQRNRLCQASQSGHMML